MLDHHETTKHFLDALSFATVLGTLTSMLPSIAALASLVWSVIRIYETKTVQGWLGNQEQDSADSK